MLETFLSLKHQKGHIMQQETPPQDPYDYTSEETELEAISKELEQAQASIEGDVAKSIAQKITPEMEELIFEDKEAFILEVFKLQNAYLEENINPKVARAKELQEGISKKQAMQGIGIAQEAFLQKHPEVDVNALMEFFLSLPPQDQERLGSLDPNNFFEELYVIYQNKNSKNKEGEGESEGLPKQLNGVGNNSALSKSGETLPMERI